MPLAEAFLLASAAFAFAPGRQGRGNFGPGVWCWPMPILTDGRPPVVSDGWGSRRDGGARQHRGVDIMYERIARVLPDEAKRDHGSIAYEVPEGTEIYAAHDGTIWSAGQTERGGAVVIDHGKPYATFYQHLSRIYPHVKKGALVKAGEPIGTCGFSPIDGARIRHLHFEIWEGGAGDHAVNPEPRIYSWAKRGAAR